MPNTYAVLEVDTGPGAEGKQHALIRGLHKSKVKASGQRSELSRMKKDGQCVRFEVMGITTALKRYLLEA